MARMKNVNGVNIPFTAEEEIARDAEEKEWADGASARNATAEIHRLEAQETSRRLAESVLSDDGKAWLTANREKIIIERAKL